MTRNSAKALLLLFCCNLLKTATLQLSSPCPNYFQYQNDQNGIYGKILFDPPSDKYVLVQVNLSVGNQIGEYRGSIQPAYTDNTELLYLLQKRKPLVYNLFFPKWINNPPRITEIRINNNIICVGPKLEPTITWISLKSELKVQDCTGVDGACVVNSGSPIQSDVGSRLPPPDTNSIITSTIRNQFHFNPTPPKKGVIFQPMNPFGNNPFLGNNPDYITSTTNKPNFIVTERIDPIKPPPPRRNNGQQPFSDICGISGATNQLVVSGQTVAKGAYPWLGAMFEASNGGLNYKCCTSLITNRHAITAAHCVASDTRRMRASEIVLVFGKHNLQQWVYSNEVRYMPLSEINVHPDYKTFNSDADVALLTLRSEIEFTTLIRPVCLWTGNNNVNDVVGQIGTVVGWGRNENGQFDTSEPKQTTLPIVTAEDCLRSAYQYRDITSNRTFCAGFRNGSGPCNGDSGSGFIIKKNGRWILRGVVSTSIANSGPLVCDLSNYVVFTDTSKFTNWLLSFIK